MLGTDVVVRKTFDLGFLSNGNDGDEKPKSLLGQIADNTQETVNILRTAVLGPSEKDLRDEGISKGDTDPPTKKGGGRFGNALKGIGSALDKVNPFSSGFAFGNIGRALLAGGGLLLLTTFRENLIGPLASLLETIKTSKIGENVNSIVTDLKERGIELFEGLKQDVERFITGMIAVGKIIKDLYLSAEEFIMSYDKDKSGKISKDEFETMVDDLVGTILSAVGKFFKDFGVEIAGIFALPGLLTLGKTMVTARVAGTAAVPA